ncbi:uncharacterized protein LOC117289655 [Asterias rubens]|uniref:uncharacterized protein LOC117289655 n=1 Tax=Asterias rubens TaxID=7604 RepID=UPI0014553114|nr:uncharacterized protein LOC117289655 [Asterias rubens]
MQFKNISILLMCLYFRHLPWLSQGSQLGEIVPDKVTDSLFSDMGRVRIGTFAVNYNTTELDVIFEDITGVKELWVIDFQPYNFKWRTPINDHTGELWSDETGQCSNMEQDLTWADGYFDDDHFQSRNTSWKKDLFTEYLRGKDNQSSEIRLDDIRFYGDLQTFLDCTRADGTNIWDYSISKEEIQYTTILYATNVRPIPGWDPFGQVQAPAVAYVQTQVKLVWRLIRTAMVNFVVSSVPIVSSRLLEEIGRLIILFDFAIVEPILFQDGSPDLTRAHLTLGFSTQLPSRNLSMVVFRKGTEKYEPEVEGNALEEVVSWPASEIADTPVCNLGTPKYCKQSWEYEMILKMDISSLVDDKPLDATGLFQFDFDSYKCENLYSTSGCALMDDLQPWEIKIDLTLQTTVDAIDEEQDSISVSIVKLVNDNGEDLRGGQTIRHKENVTVEVNFSPAFLRSHYVLELQLFMVCMGDEHMDSLQGCLGASESQRYSAFVGEDFSFTFDPSAPQYQNLPQATTAPPTVSQDLQSVLPTAVPTYTIEKTLTQEYNVWADVVEGGVFIRPHDPSLIQNLGEPSSSLHFLQDETDDQLMSLLYLVEPYTYPGASGHRPTNIANEDSFYQYFLPQLDHYHILGTVRARTKGILHSKDTLKMFYSAFTNEPARLSYVGTENPVQFPCNRYQSEAHRWLYYQQNWVALPTSSCRFIMELINLRKLVVEIVTLRLTTSQEPLDQVVFVQELSRLADVLKLEPDFLTSILEFGAASNGEDWTVLDLLLYTILLFQDDFVIVALEPTGFLLTLRDDLRSIADEEGSFSSFVEESVRLRGNNDHIELATVLQIVSELILYRTDSIFVRFYLATRFSNDYWQSVDIDESFYYFLWSVNSVGSAEYEGQIFTTISNNPQISLNSNKCQNYGYLAGYAELCRINWVEVHPFWAYTSPVSVPVEVYPGGWGLWSVWTGCTKSCGGGVQTRERECIDVEAECVGQATSESRLCNLEDCDVFTDSEGHVMRLELGLGRQTWQHAREYCQSKGGNLARIKDHMMQDFLIGDVTSDHHTSTGQFWFDANDIMEEGSFVSSDNAPLSFTNWRSSHGPSQSSPTKNCGAFSIDGFWENQDCTNVNHFVCQYDFMLVFKAAADTGQSVYEAWTSSSYSADDVSSEQTLYKSGLVESWSGSIVVEEVKVAMLVNGQPVVEVSFDGRDTNKMNWFAPHRLISSPYADMESAIKNFFSVDGHKSLGRHFFMSNYYKGCLRQYGWMIVIDAGHYSHPCKWERLPTYPKFFFSKDTKSTNFNGGQVGIADEFAVYIKYKTEVYIPPPPTLPPPAVYTSESISAPPPGSELQSEGYDTERQVHQSQLQNTVLSGERNHYTMTTVYSLVSIDDMRTKRDGHRARRTLIASAKLPQLRSAQFVSEGCPPGSEFNPIDLSCDCLKPDWFYSEDSFQCKPTINAVQEDDVIQDVPDNAHDSAAIQPLQNSHHSLLVLVLVLNWWLFFWLQY